LNHNESINHYNSSHEGSFDNQNQPKQATQDLRHNSLNTSRDQETTPCSTKTTKTRAFNSLAQKRYRKSTCKSPQRKQSASQLSGPHIRTQAEQDSCTRCRPKRESQAQLKLLHEQKSLSETQRLALATDEQEPGRRKSEARL
jgi:hypothetical protein